MKKILITGANSYIGTSFERYATENHPGEYVIDTVDMIDGSWREKSFEGYDVIFHVAGIAHQKETKQNAPLYYSVNCDLAVEAATKAKNDGAKQFIFLSSMSIYGMDTGVITKETNPAPKSHYGKSKWKAEQAISPLADENFKVCILRPPMVYGKDCKGNYQSIVRLVKKISVFPKVNNQRSAICVENLVRFALMAVALEMAGVYFPQNAEYVNTQQLAREIAQENHRRLYFSLLCGFAVVLLRPFVSLLKKAFGNLIYKGTEEFEFCYCDKESFEKRLR